MHYASLCLCFRLIIGINGMVKNQEEAMNRLNSHLVDLPGQCMRLIYHLSFDIEGGSVELTFGLR